MNNFYKSSSSLDWEELFYYDAYEYSKIHLILIERIELELALFKKTYENPNVNTIYKKWYLKGIKEDRRYLKKLKKQLDILEKSVQKN